MRATDYATSLNPGDSVRWKRLELHAFESHPTVQRTLDPSSKHGRRKTWRDRAGIAMAIAMFVVMLAPVLGLGLLFSGRFSAADIDFAFAVPAAGVLFFIACLFAVPSAVDSVRRWVGGQAGFGAYAVIVGGATLIGATVRQPEDDVPFRALWILPIAVFVLSGAALIVVGLFGTREPKRSRDKTADSAALRRHAQIENGLEELSDQERHDVAQDLHAAIDDLAQRGVIRPQDAAWAEGAQLGGLSRRMSEPRR